MATSDVRKSQPGKKRTRSAWPKVPRMKQLDQRLIMHIQRYAACDGPDRFDL